MTGRPSETDGPATTATMSAMLAEASDLCARGLSVIPIEHGGKRPSVPWTPYQTRLATSEEILQWFGNGHQRNIGIVTGGVSNVVVVDCDSAAAVAWADNHLPPTPMMSRTARGQHRFYRHPGQPVRNRASIRTSDPEVKIDVRGDGGYVVAPGSLHASGALYERIGEWLPVGELPIFEAGWIEPPARELVPRSAAPVRARDQVIDRARAYLDRVPPARQGEGGDTHTFTVVCRVVRGFDLGDEDALDVLGPWNSRCVPPWSEADLRDKIAGARKYGTEPIGELASPALILNPQDPLPSAREYVARQHTVDGTISLRHQSGIYLAYEPAAGAYLEQDEAAVRAQVYSFLENAKRRVDDKTVPFQPTRAKVENVLDGLRAVTNLPASMAAPCYLRNDPGLDPLDMLACPNGLLHIPTRTLHLPTPDFFTRNAIDFYYDPFAPEPQEWLKFLESVWPDDRESITTAQEVFGYMLTPDTRFQKIIAGVGPPRAGKGILGRVLSRVVGERNVCSPTLAAFGRDFGKHVLIGKTVAIISDARIGGRTDTASVAETLLSISGEDSQTIERKFLPDWSGKLSTRFLLLTNELPHIGDVSGALAKRFIILAFRNSFYGREDLGLFDRLVAELPGILNWALEGRDRLYERGYFVQPKSAVDLIQELTDLGSPEAAFLRQHTEIEHGATVSQRELFAAWVTWCMDNGRDRPGTAQTFGRNVRAALPWVTTRQLGARGEQERHWEGMRLIDIPARPGKPGDM